MAFDVSSLGGSGGGGGGVEAKSSAETTFGDRYGQTVGDSRFLWIALGVAGLLGLVWLVMRRRS